LINFKLQNIKYEKSLLLLVAVFQIISVIAQTQPISAKQIDSLTELVIKTFNVPGIAVGVVKDGKLIHAKGYGVANLTTGKKWMSILCLV